MVVGDMGELGETAVDCHRQVEAKPRNRRASMKSLA